MTWIPPALTLLSPLTVRIISSINTAQDVTFVTTEVLGSELLTGWTNSPTYPFETFTTSGGDITSAINTTTLGLCYKDIGAVAEDEIYKATFTYTRNSGSIPYLISGSNSGGDVPRNVYQQVSVGANTIYWVVTTARANDYIVFIVDAAADFEIASMSVKKVTNGRLTIAHDLSLGSATDSIGFYGATPVALQTGVTVDAAGIHAALVNLGLITA